jgi:hypothetical protein
MGQDNNVLAKYHVETVSVGYFSFIVMSIFFLFYTLKLSKCKRACV